LSREKKQRGGGKIKKVQFRNLHRTVERAKLVAGWKKKCLEDKKRERVQNQGQGVVSKDNRKLVHRLVVLKSDLRKS